VVRGGELPAASGDGEPGGSPAHAGINPNRRPTPQELASLQEHPMQNDSRADQWGRFIATLILFLFLFAVLDLTPLARFLHTPLETFCSAALK